MIGVLASVEDLPVVEEFFELFKTPWELYHADRSYDVVLATAGDVPDTDAGLVVICRPRTLRTDASHDVDHHAVGETRLVEWDGVLLPIYGALLTFEGAVDGTPCVTSPLGVAGVRVRADGRTVVRLGYDLFAEVRALLSSGQPVEHAHIPTLDLHIRMLRQWILDADLPLIEIAPTASGHDFLVCLTHDIDFVGIRRHRFDHTVLGFLYRSTVGAVRNVFRRRLSLAQLLQSWKAALSLPLVYLRWARDFWEPFDWYLQVEHGLPATYYLIPFKGRAGERVPGRGAARRATAYDVTDIKREVASLMRADCEIGVHGLDAWHSAEKGRDELTRVSSVTRSDRSLGIRMHWLLNDTNTPAVLEQAGFAYDSTAGYNETIGYRNGTTQVFRPLGVKSLLELPMHLQDGALFYPQRLDLSESEAEQRCGTFIERAHALGGVLTVLWHDRSHGPERFWGGFYMRLVGALKKTNAWFCTAGQAVTWFRQRRAVQFDVVEDANGTSIRLRHDGPPIEPPLKVVMYRASNEKSPIERPWNGQTVLAFASDRQPRHVSTCI